MMEFVYSHLAANTALHALLTRGLDAIGADINPIDYDDEFILIEKDGGADKEVVNRGDNRQWHEANVDINVYGAKGWNYDQTKPIIDEIDRMFITFYEGPTTDGYVENFKRTNLWRQSEYEGGQLIPRTIMRYGALARATA